MRKKLLHGTDYESGMKILKHGFNTRLDNTVWDCSNCYNTYLIDKEYDSCEAIEFATNAGKISAAVKKSTSSDIIIFEIDVDDKYLSADTSCSDWDDGNNMEDCYQIDSDVLNKLIATGEIQLKTYVMMDVYVPDLRLFYLPYKNPYFSYESDLEETLVTMLNSTENYTMDDFIWEETNDLIPLEEYLASKPLTLIA